MKLLLPITLSILSAYSAFAITPDANGVYEISTPRQLEEFAEIVNNGNTTANAILTSDIDMTGVSHTAIGNSKERAYTGTFNGRFHTISSIVMKNANGENLALFGYVAPGVKLCNTIIDEFSEFYGADKCASFVGQAVGAETGEAVFECLGSAAKVTAYSSDTAKGRASGLVGPSDGKVKYRFINCYNTGEVRGAKVGGLSAYAPIALCQGCFVVTNVKEQVTSGASAKNPSPVGQIFIGGTETFNGEWTYNFFFGGSASKGTFYPKVYNSGQAWNKASWASPANGHPNGVYKVFQSDWASSGALCYFLNNKSVENPVWGQNLDENEPFPTFIPGKRVVTGDVTAFTFTNSEAVTKNDDYPGDPDNPDIPDGEINIKGKVTCDGIGVANVQVSDGVKITFTNEKGEYALSSDKECGYVFICNPKGYMPVIKDGYPQFYKNLWTPVSKPRIEEMDFELVKQNTYSHNVLMLADIQLSDRYNDHSQYREFVAPDVNRTINELSDNSTNTYIITLGDQSYDNYWHLGTAIPQIKNMLSEIKPAAWFHCMGNHDNNPDIAGDWAASSTYRYTWGPTYYSFNLGEVHYVVLDNIEYLNPGANRNDRSYNENIVNQVLKWFRKDLENADKESPLVICMHAPYLSRPQCTSPDVVEGVKYRYTWGSKFDTSIQGFKNVKVFTGHAHTNYVVLKGATTEYNVGAACGNLWRTGSYLNGNSICTDGSVGGYRVMEVEGNDVHTYYKSIGFDKSYQFRVYDLNHCHIVNDVYCSNRDGGPLEQFLSDGGFGYNSADYYDNGQAKKPNRIMINAFGYDTRWKVEAFENGKSLNVQRVSAYDPLAIISDAVKCYEIKGNVAGEPSLCSHLFIAQAQTSDAPVTVKVTNEYGVAHYQTIERPKQLKIANHLPGAEGSGIQPVLSEDYDCDAPVVYYNLNGLQVENPSNGLFIRRQGSKVSKILIP